MGFHLRVEANDRQWAKDIVSKVERKIADRRRTKSREMMAKICLKLANAREVRLKARADVRAQYENRTKNDSTSSPLTEDHLGKGK
jgi:hypothetical protein